MTYLNREAKMQSIYEVLVANPNGVTIHGMAVSTAMTRNQVKSGIHELREVLGTTDSLNVVCEPDVEDPNSEWLYRLVGNTDDARWWSTNRISDMDSRIKTMHHIASSLARDLDGRSIEGRKARIYKKGLARLVEDVAELAP